MEGLESLRKLWAAGKGTKGKRTGNWSLTVSNIPNSNDKLGGKVWTKATCAYSLSTSHWKREWSVAEEGWTSWPPVEGTLLDECVFDAVLSCAAVCDCGATELGYARWDKLCRRYNNDNGSSIYRQGLSLINSTRVARFYLTTHRSRAT